MTKTTDDYYEKFNKSRKSRLQQTFDRIKKCDLDSTLLINLSYLSEKTAEDIRTYILNKLSEDIKRNN